MSGMKGNYKQFTVKREIPFKSGLKIPVGEKLKIAFEEINHKYIVHLKYNDQDFKVRTGILNFLNARPPSMRTLERWSEDGVAKSVFGKRVEVDGVDSDGSPSWFIIKCIV